PLVVLVTDDKGSAVAGVSVSWAAQGGGSVSSTAVKSGSDGRASVERTLGPTPGPQTTTATVAGLQGSPVSFEATATEGPPPTAEIAITNNPPTGALDGEVFAPIAQPAVRVTDASGPIGNVSVTATIASGGGTLEGNTTATTNANGDAVFGDLGISGTGSQTLEFAAGTATVQSSPVTISVLSPKATSGEWGPVVSWDIVPLHMSLLPNGKIFAWGKREVADTMGMPRIWDPAAGPPIGLAEIHVGDMLFCAGHTLLPDGRLMVAGGHHMDDAGIKATYFFSQNGNPVKGPDMAFGRWYPTLTVLPNGNVLSMAGRNEAGNVVRVPELWNGNGWAQLTGADTLIPYYPRNFVDPVREGQIFYAGERIVSRWFDYRGSGSWTTSGPAHIWKFNRDYGTAVMYDAGKILYAGGGGDQGWSTPDKPLSNVPTATGERIDLNEASPTWQPAGSMSSPRRHLNSTILPDGEVLITGGLSGGGFNNIATAVKTAEIWNPATNGWTTLAPGSVARGYHSVSLLLPDGTVLHGASGDASVPGSGGAQLYPPEKNHQIFSPPYLFKGARPSISSAPGTVGYRETFSVATPNAAQIEDARWIRLGSVTHAFDMSQRANTLSFTRTATGVDITAPDNSKLAPPGYYMLFILNRNGVPSEGKIIKVE
ncbi:MAG: galactose oxidase-like domain-containing protein, partial [Gemmatimonadales bacterium]